jgi:DNA relaxase NicK
MKSGLVIVDYLTVTFGLDGESDKCTRLWDEIADLMLDHDIELKARAKGLYSYHNSALLHVPGSTGDGHNCGHVAWTDEDGVTGLMVEITGSGCEFLRARGEYDGLLEMYSLILAYDGRISRVDFALDLMHSYCMESNITVPMLGKRGNDGEFRSDFSPSHVKQKENQQGDWSDITFGGLSVEQYNPELHGTGGLTYYLGSAKSDNQIVFYEKGKQLLGGISGLSEKQQLEFKALAENENRSELEQKRFVTLSNKSGYDGQYEDKKGWVRVERRMRRKNSKKIIDPGVLLNPDSAFCMGFKGLRAVLDEYSVWVKGTYADIATFQNKRVNMVKAVLLSNKTHWAKMHAGGLVRTLIAEGYSDTAIVDMLKREEGLKEYVFDLLELT